MQNPDKRTALTLSIVLLCSNLSAVTAMAQSSGGRRHRTSVLRASSVAGCVAKCPVCCSNFLLRQAVTVAVQGGMHDAGFGAEDVAGVEPLLVTRNDKDEVEGVKYDRISVALVNAVKQQQEQIQRQQNEIE